MAAKPTEASQVISDVAHDEGGTTKGSKSAQMQSELTKQRNLEETVANVGSKLETAPGSITKEDAQAVHRAESRALGGQQPQSGSISSQAQHEAAVNEGAASTSRPAAPSDPTVQSQMDRQANFEDAASGIGSKLVNEPGNVTKEEADTLHSREQRAFGRTEKGGLASQAQHQVAENEGATTGRSGGAPADPSMQSQQHRQANFEDIAAKVGNKLEKEPGNITKEEADTLHSREHRALGHTEKGGVAAQAQHQAAENLKS
ncbi:MAG: hypothetical protein LQ348_005756 [Seirophora lacunosa]|nr:MAG: hypothetical protein LQ348_005756 [Seirophora lacunosa]